MATLFVDKIDPQSGTALEIGTSGDTITVPSGATFNVAGTPGTNIGKILQVVSANTTSATTITAQTFVDSGITADITPTSSSSKVLILISCQCFHTLASRASSINGVNILRDSTEIYGGGNNNAMGLYTPSTTNFQMWGMYALSYLDSPATGSAITYKVQGRIETTGESITFQYGSMNSNIHLLEVQA